MPRTIVVVRPQPLIGWEDAQAHLRLDGDDEMVTVEGFIDAACNMIDGPDGDLRRAIGIQTLETRFDGFGHPGWGMAPSLQLCPDVIAVEQITYLDSANVAQTIANTGYQLIGNDLEPAFGSAWPHASWGRETVRVRYTAGIVVDPTDPAPTQLLPDAIRAALLLMVGDLYENRSTTLDARAAGAVAVPMSTTVENLLGRFKVWR